MDLQVSIIVPFYRTSEESFRACIFSLICQTYSNLEILVIDDGSGDEYQKILEITCGLDSRIHLLHKNINSGLSDTRNYGLQKCTGDYVIFVDSDDTLSKHAIEYMVYAIQEYNADFVIGGLKITNTYNEGSDENPEYILLNSVDAIRILMTNGGFGSTACGRLASKKLWTKKSNEPFIKGRLHEDLASTWEIITESKKICWVKAGLYNYYQGGNSEIHAKTVSEKFCKDYIWALERRNNGVADAYPELENLVTISYLQNYPNIYVYTDCIEDKKLSENYKNKIKNDFKNIYSKFFPIKNLSIKTAIKIKLFRYFPNIYCSIYRIRRKAKGLRF